MTLPTHIKVDPIAPKPSQLLRQALALFGPNGERWIKRTKKKRSLRFFIIPTYYYCSIGAIEEVNTPNQRIAELYLQRACYPADTIIYFNDFCADNFADIRDKFNEAIALAEADGN